MPTPSVRIRLSDVAAQAGVSTATVSRVLNAKPSVSAETRQNVLAALDLLGYDRPTTLRRRNVGLVGLVVPELSNPIFPAFAQAIESALAERGFTPLLCTQSPGGVSEDEYVEMLLAHGVDGIVFVAGRHADTRANHERYWRLAASGLPIVLINGRIEGLDAPLVAPDDGAGMRRAVAHLTALGHRRIGLALGPQQFVPSQRKLAGFVAGLVGCGLSDGSLPDDAAWASGAGSPDGAPPHDPAARTRPDPGAPPHDPAARTRPDPGVGQPPTTNNAAAKPAAEAGHVVASFYTVEGGYAAATELLDSGHTALVCSSDLMALGAIRAARARGLRVPQDVSIIGYDDSLLMAFTDPPLTTIRQPVLPMARAAVNALVTEISGHRAPRTELLFEPELIMRGSTAPPAQ